MPKLGIFGKGLYAQHVLYPLRASGSRTPDVPARTNLKQLRALKGYSQSTLAEKIGTTLNMYGKLERGDRRLNMDWLRRLASALDVGMDGIVAEVDHDETLPTGLPVPTLDAVRAMISVHYQGASGQEMEAEMLNDLAERILDSVENWKDDPAAACDPQVARSVARQINRRFDR